MPKFDFTEERRALADLAREPAITQGHPLAPWLAPINAALANWGRPTKYPPRPVVGALEGPSAEAGMADRVIPVIQTEGYPAFQKLVAGLPSMHDV